jgi:hypothetical protein
VGAVVDATGLRIGRMALAEGEEVPEKAAVRVLRQLEDEAERCHGRALPPERNVELGAARQIRPAVAVSFAEPQIERRLPAFDFPKSLLGLEARARAHVQAPHLLRPLLTVESRRDGAQLLSCVGHADTIGACRK